MKIKTIHDQKKGESYLTVKLTKSEKLDYAQAELLRTLSAPFLAFSYATEKDGATVLSYNVLDTIALDTYLGAELSRTQFRALLLDIADAVEACAAQGFSYTELLFEVKSVCIDAETNHIKFAYLPATSLDSKRASIIDLLRSIANRAKFVRKEDKPCSESLLDFLKRQTIFSLVDFKAFIDSGELKTHTGALVSAVETGDLSDSSATGQGSGRLASGSLGSGALVGSGSLEGASGTNNEEAGAYDFVKAQVGSVSAHETRASKSLAEQISFDVADVASAPAGATGAANWDDVASSSLTAPPPNAMPVAGIAPPPPSSAPVADIAPPSGAVPVENIAPPFDAMPAEDITPPPSTAPVENIAPPPSTTPVENIAPPPSALPITGIAPPMSKEPPAALSFFIVRVDTGERYSLPLMREITIGRSKRCDIRISGNTNISRVHAILKATDEGCSVTDQGATNKTSIGGRDLVPHKSELIAPGDEISLADERFRLEVKS